MRESRPKEKFAWRPVRTVSGKRIWLKKCVRVDKYIWGIAGELPLVDKEYYTVNEFLVEMIKNPPEESGPPPRRRGPRLGY